ncbi:E3 ubiquitin-protein ligase SPL2 isoform X2 [Durio zibethinus]|uniref:RING-type E3 ubiquitin transferase n=1 Tax=Durio zibethinus TaxID=66656 RepID=A0A6P5X096_DURZI|nr:E3 ubiquitin-protein ligase SPL2 isoform X2 [Durio zibethinus]
MSSHEQALASLISQLALSFDGAILGAALAYAALRTIFRFKSTSTALRKIRGAPSLRVADLRCLVEEDKSDSTEEPVVIIRGAVDARSAADGRSWKSLKNDVLVSQESGDKAVVIQRTQTYIYHEWRGLFGWTSDLRAIIGRSWNKKEITSMRTVPFILVQGGQWPQSDCVIVNMDGSRHSLPLTTVYHQLQPINASAYTFLQALFGHEYPVGLLDEEKILPLGKEISAVGICGFNNGVPEIKSCKELPYFLNWNKWKEWRLRRFRQSTHAATDDATSEIASDEEAGDVPDGELCVICLMRRRRSAFIPCGHLVCCQRCAVSVERELVPKCPVCRMAIRSSVRIYAS